MAQYLAPDATKQLVLPAIDDQCGPVGLTGLTFFLVGIYA